MELRNRKLSEENVEETEQNIKQEMGNSNEQSNLPKSLESVPGSAKMHLELAVDSTAMDVEAVVKEATEAMDIADEDADTRSDSNITDDGDDNMGNDELGSVSGGFLGDFEEIEEDEDVERFISLNHTPLPSARQSPAPLVLPQNNNPSAQQPIPESMNIGDNESSDDDSDGSFESIPEASAHTVALRTGDGQPLTDTACPSLTEADSDIGESNELVQTTGIVGAEPLVKEPTSPLSSGNNNTAGVDMKRIRILQQQFREKFIPKLSTDMFFSPDIYKKYSIVATAESTLTNSSEAPASVCASVKPAAVLQKPSSLRRNNSINSPAVQKPMEGKDNLPGGTTSYVEAVVFKDQELKANDSMAEVVTSAQSKIQLQNTANNQSVSRPQSPSRISIKTKPAQTDKDDDVVETLLGVMKSPKIGINQQQPMPQQQQQQPTQQQQPKVQKSSQQGIPDDMLAALAAIEGGGIVEAPKSPVTKGVGHSFSAKELAAKLPNGYSGPFSQLSTVEHAHFLALAQKAKSGSLNNKETIDYQRLRAKVDAEQQRFRTQAHEKALPLLKQIAETISQTAHERLVEGSAKALEQYPHMYMPVQVAAIRSSASGYIPLLYKETLLQRGTCYHTQMPKLDGASVEGIVSPAANPWDYAQSNGKFSRRMGMPVSQDLVALELARLAHADVVVSASSLIALLTLPQSYMRDVVIPFKVISELPASKGGILGSDSNLAKDSDTPAHSILLVDKPLLSMQASTPRKHNQIFYEASVCNKLVDRSRPLELGGGSMANATTELSNSMHGSTKEPAENKENEFSSDNANYTLWEFGGLRVLVRYGVHGFFAGDNAGKARAPVTTTVTLKTKLEYQLEGKSVEAAIASASANGEDGAGIGRGAYEDITESERLSWWMSSYLRGSPSEVWVSHVDVQRSGIVRVTRHTCGDLFPGTGTVGASGGGSSSGTQPSTRGLLALLQDLNRQPVGEYMLIHKRRTWDATIYRALERQPEDTSVSAQQRTNAAMMNLEAELRTSLVADLTQLDIEGDYVPVAWHGLPGQIPFTYAPADLAEFCATASTWNSNAAAGGIKGNISNSSTNNSARNRRRAANKRKKAKKVATAAANL
ncbi:hypothetical protein GGI26_001554 [Coemansia sp. RSA 1358]|uniref:Little elongation complex subunit 2 C-terminal domain-containing protein n=1 Tax=Coemansia umbellata TaxID=1424467 RepID=A0ABQ8PSA1_9FUNG|nr:hypothetical protein EDC05_001530 [Coemansia umbellata]KAJ2624419.1 hypothetical protein GGI26_001554 [Coemansia sp. RSA 1358]